MRVGTEKYEYTVDPATVAVVGSPSPRTLEMIEDNWYDILPMLTELEQSQRRLDGIRGMKSQRQSQLTRRPLV